MEMENTMQELFFAWVRGRSSEYGGEDVSVIE